MARHGRDLGELLELLDLRDAILVGASMGGNTLWAYVDQFGPSRLAGAVVVDQTPKMLNDAAWPHGFYGYDATNAATFFDHGVPQLDGGRTVDRSGPAVARLAERLGGFPTFRDSAAPETLGLLRDHALQDWRDVVRRFPLPLLMLAGRESQVWSCEHAAAAVAGTAHGRALVVEDAGHAISIDQPDVFNELLLDFVAEIGASVR
jgi:pimeloyl-ACP methyl ester carboxylesterase